MKIRLERGDVVLEYEKQHMKPEQKYNLLMSVVWAIPICAVVLGFFSLFH